ncbi:MAG: hypothetical protein WDW38_010400 [Sanguina aurantia]
MRARAVQGWGVEVRTLLCRGANAAVLRCERCCVGVRTLLCRGANAAVSGFERWGVEVRLKRGPWVVGRGEELLKRCCALDSVKPAVNLEDPVLAAALFSLFHGNSGETTLDSSVPADRRRAPAGPGLRSRLVGLMCRSVAAANRFPAVVQTISECVLGAGTTLRLKQQGVEFAVWVFKHAGEAELRAMAPVVLEGLIRTIEDSAGGGDQASMTLRGFAYTAVGCLAQRVPTLFHARIDIARSFFAALSDEPPGLRATLQEAVGSLAVAYKDLPATARSEVDALLLDSITNGKDAVRLCATQWANKLFPFDHPPARYICVVAAGDAKLEVREEGLRGLQLSPAQQQLLQQQAEGGSSTASTAASALAALVWPPLGHMVGHLRMRVPRLFAAWDINRGLALPQRSYMALIQFLQLCKKKSTAAAAAHTPPPPTAAAPHDACADTAMTDPPTTAAGDGIDGDGGDVYAHYSALLECGLVREAGGELLEVALEALLELATDPPGRWGVAAQRWVSEQDGAPASESLWCRHMAKVAGSVRGEGVQKRRLGTSVVLLRHRGCATSVTVFGCVTRDGGFAQHLPWLRTYTSHVSAPVRTSGAKLLGVAAAALSPADAISLLASLSATAATAPMPATATLPAVPASSSTPTPATSTTAAAASPPEGSAATASSAAAATAHATATAPATSAPSKASSSAKQEEQEGALLALGYVLAQLRLSHPAPEQTGVFAALRSAAAALAEAMHSSNAVLAAAAAAALGLVALRGPLQPLLLDPSNPPSAAAAVASEPTQQPRASVSAVQQAVLPDSNGSTSGDMAVDTQPVGTTGPVGSASAPVVTAAVQSISAATTAAAAAAAAATPAVAPAGAAAVLVPAAAPATAAAVVGVKEPRGSLGGVVSRLVELMGDKDVKVAGRAVIAAGHMARGMPCKEVLTPILASLYKLCFNKAEDIQFAVGEALSYAFGAVPITAHCILRTNFLSLADEFAILRGGEQAPVAAASSVGAVAAAAAAAAATPGDAMEVAGAAEEAPPAAAAVSEDLAAAQSQILDKILKELIHHSRSEVRCAAVVWLVSLLTYCCTGGGQATANKGAGSSSSSGAGATATAGAGEGVSAATAVAAAAVPVKIQQLLPAIQGALSGLLGDSNELAQEMASRGVSLVYSLGDEATRKTLMAALVGVLQGAPQPKTQVKLSGETQVFEEGAIGSVPGGGGMSTYKELCALATDLGQPDLIYKFMYDPNPRVQDAMGAIWRSLVDDPKAAVEAHFGPIIAELLREMGGRQWRNRQAACGALADLVQGRRWAELCPHFGEVWSMMLRAMDDIKESVRQAAIGLARSVRGLTLRMVDPQAATPADAAATFSVLLPLLLEQGLASNVSEVRIVTLDTLAKASKVAGPAVLRPHLAPLVVTMLEALSNLEDARLNYVEQHAERMGFDNDKLEGARVVASRSGPVGDTLDLAVRYADEASLGSLIPALTGLLKRGVGLNTKVGTARFIRSLVVHSASAIAPHAPALLKALTSGAFAERSNTVRKAYAAAAAQVARHASPARVDKFVAGALSAYSEGSDDADRRLVGGLLLKELLKGAPETSAACAAAILPTAFGAKMDEDEGVAAVWKTVWEEGVSSEAGAIRLYAVEIVELLLQGLASQSWGRKKACAEAVGGLAEVAAQLLDACAKHVTTHADKASTPPTAATATATATASPPSGTATTSSATATADATMTEAEEVSKPWPLVEVLKCLSAAISHAGGATTPTAAAAAAADLSTADPSTASAPSDAAAVPAVCCRADGGARFDAQLAALIPALTSIVGASLPWQARMAAIAVLRSALQRVAAVAARASRAAAATLAAPAALKVATCVSEIKIQALREAGLAALLEMVVLAEGGGLWGQECVGALLAQVKEIEDGEKSGGIVAAAGKVREALSGSGLALSQPTCMEV